VLRGYELDTPHGRQYFVVNRQLARVCSTNEDAVRLVNWLEPSATIEDLIRAYPDLVAAVDPNLPAVPLPQSS
jgi:hypothetical protein